MAEEVFYQEVGPEEAYYGGYDDYYPYQEEEPSQDEAGYGDCYLYYLSKRIRRTNLDRFKSFESFTPSLYCNS